MADFSAGNLIAMPMTVGVLMNPLRRLDNFIRLRQEGYTGFTRAMEQLEEEPTIANRPGATPLGTVAGKIGFQNVRFRYETAGRLVFYDLTLTIRSGEFVALVGPSGVGKSTLCSLIARFYGVETGLMTLDGRDVRDIELSSLRRYIGVVQQDVYLFSGTVWDYLLYGRPWATRAEVVEEAKAASAPQRC